MISCRWRLIVLPDRRTRISPSTFICVDIYCEWPIVTNEDWHVRAADATYAKYMNEINETSQYEVDSAVEPDCNAKSCANAIPEDAALPKYAYVPNGEERLLIYDILRRGSFGLKALDRVYFAPAAYGERNSVKCSIELRPKSKFDITNEGLEMLNAMSRSFSGQDADIIDVLSMVYIEKAQAPGEWITITVSDICRLRGLSMKNAGKNRKGETRRSGYTSAQKRKVSESLTRLYFCQVTIEKIETVDGKKIPKTYSGQLIEFNVPPDNWDGKTITYRLTDILGNRTKKAAWQASLLPLKVLNYDAGRNEWEKSIARYLYWLFRVRVSKNTQGNTHLAQTLIAQVLGQDARVTTENVKRLERALEQLKQDQLIGSWTLKPPSKILLVPDPNRTAYEIILPDDILEHYRSMRKDRRATETRTEPERLKPVEVAAPITVQEMRLPTETRRDNVPASMKETMADLDKLCGIDDVDQAESEPECCDQSDGSTEIPLKRDEGEDELIDIDKLMGYVDIGDEWMERHLGKRY